MVETSLDRRNGDLFWRKKNLLTTAEVLKKAEKSFSMLPESGAGTKTGQKNELAELLINDFVKETGADPQETVMGDLPGFKMPEPFMLDPEEREIIGLTGCREAFAKLTALTGEYPGLFNIQSLSAVLFNNEGVAECRERAAVLRESIEGMIAEDAIRHLNDIERKELLEMLIESEVIARTTFEIISFVMWAADRTLVELKDTIAEDFIAMNSTLIRKSVSQYMTIPGGKE